MIEYLKIFLPIYIALLFFTIILLRVYIVWKKTGINAYLQLKKNGVEGIVTTYFRLLPFASLLLILAYSFFPAYYQYLAPFYWLAEQTIIINIGIVLLIASLAWIWISQHQMGISWRIGIDEKNKTSLVTKGIFLYSRNPIFLGIKINLLGFFLVTPNALTLTIAVTGSMLIDIQISLEEQFLLKFHGEHYKKYCKKVRRWI